MPDDGSDSSDSDNQLDPVSNFYVPQSVANSLVNTPENSDDEFP